MKISSRFSIAVHTLLCIQKFQDSHKVTSDFIAGSVNVNPVVIRRTLIMLKNAGLIDVARGTGGTSFTKPLSQITLLDVYNAVDAIDGTLFAFHENPNPQCPVGGKIHSILDAPMDAAQKAMEESLKQTTLEDLRKKNRIMKI